MWGSGSSVYLLHSRTSFRTLKHVVRVGIHYVDTQGPQHSKPFGDDLALTFCCAFPLPCTIPPWDLPQSLPKHDSKILALSRKWDVVGGLCFLQFCDCR